MLYAVGVVTNDANPRTKKYKLFGFKLYNTETNSFEYMEYSKFKAYADNRTKIENLVIVNNNDTYTVRGKYIPNHDLPRYILEYDDVNKCNVYRLKTKRKTVVVIRQDIDDDTDILVRYHAVDCERGYFVIEDMNIFKIEMHKICNCIIQGTTIDMKCKEHRVVRTTNKLKNLSEKDINIQNNIEIDSSSKNYSNNSNTFITDEEARNKDIDWSLLRFMRYYSQKKDKHGQNLLNSIIIKGKDTNNEDILITPSLLSQARKVTKIQIDMQTFNCDILHFPCGVEHISINMVGGTTIDTLIVGRRTDKLDITREYSSREGIIKVNNLHIMSDNCEIVDNSITLMNIKNYSIRGFKRNRISGQFNNCILYYLIDEIKQLDSIYNSFNNTKIYNTDALELNVGYSGISSSFNEVEGIKNILIRYKDKLLEFKNFGNGTIFCSFNNIKDLELNNLTLVGINSLENSFRNIKLSKYIDLEKVFVNCKEISLKQTFNQNTIIDVDDVNLTAKITELIGSFFNVKVNKQLEIPESLIKLDESSFLDGFMTWKENNKLKEISFNQRQVDVKTEILKDYKYNDICGYKYNLRGEMFKDILTLPLNTEELGVFSYLNSSIKYIDKNNVNKIGEGAFFKSEITEFNTLDFPKLKELNKAFLGSLYLEKLVLGHNIEKVTTNILYNEHYNLDGILKENGELNESILAFLCKNLTDIVIADTVQLSEPLLPVDYTRLKRLSAKGYDYFNKLVVHVVKNSSAHKAYSKVVEPKVVLRLYDSIEELYSSNNVTKELKEEALNTNIMIRELGDLTNNTNLNNIITNDKFIGNALKIVEAYEELSSSINEDDCFIKYDESDLYSDRMTTNIQDMMYKNPLKIKYAEHYAEYNRLIKEDDTSSDCIKASIRLEDEPIQLISYLNLIRMIFKREDNLHNLDENNLGKYYINNVDSDSAFNKGTFKSQYADNIYEYRNFRLEVFELNKIMGEVELTYDAIAVNYLCLVYTFEENDYILYMTPISIDGLTGHTSILNYNIGNIPVSTKTRYNLKSTIGKTYTGVELKNRRYADVLTNSLTIGDSYNNRGDAHTLNKVEYPSGLISIFSDVMREIFNSNMIIFPLKLDIKVTKSKLKEAKDYFVYNKINGQKFDTKLVLKQGSQFLGFNLVNQKFYLLSTNNDNKNVILDIADISEYDELVTNNLEDIVAYHYISIRTIIEDISDITVREVYTTSNLRDNKLAWKLISKLREDNHSLFSNNNYKFFIITKEEQEELYKKYKDEHKYSVNTMIEEDDYFKISTALDRLVYRLGYADSYNYTCTDTEEVEVEYNADEFENGKLLSYNMDDEFENYETELVDCKCLNFSEHAIEKLFRCPLATKLSTTKILSDAEKQYIRERLTVSNFYKLNDGSILEEYEYVIYRVNTFEVTDSDIKYNIYLYRYNSISGRMLDLEYDDAYILPDKLNNLISVLVENQRDIIYNYYSYNNSKFRFFQREQHEDIVLLLSKDILLANFRSYNYKLKHEQANQLYLESTIDSKCTYIGINLALDKESEELFLVIQRYSTFSEVNKENSYYKVFRFKNIEKALTIIDKLIIKNKRALISLYGLLELFDGTYNSYEYRYIDNGMKYKSEFLNILYRLQFNEYTPNMPCILQTNAFDYIELFSNLL